MFMGDLMKLTGAVSIVGPILVYIIIYFIETDSKQHFEGIKRIGLCKIVLFFYTGVILYLTIIKKLPSGTEHRLNLSLFWSYQKWSAADVRWQVYMNVFLFIPFGFFMKGKICKTFFLSIALATTIELTQYIFRLGLCELDDIFHNTLGAMIGCMYYLVIEALWGKVSKKLM